MWDNPGPEQVLTFRTNVGDVVEAGAEHPLRFETDAENGGLKPYLHVRGRLEARLGRAVMYELAELGETVEIDGRDMFAVRSGGEWFAMMPADELERAASSDGQRYSTSGRSRFTVGDFRDRALAVRCRRPGRCIRRSHPQSGIRRCRLAAKPSSRQPC